jgi:hypothetical protein
MEKQPKHVWILTIGEHTEAFANCESAIEIYILFMKAITLELSKRMCCELEPSSLDEEIDYMVYMIKAYFLNTEDKEPKYTIHDNGVLVTLQKVPFNE